MDRRVDSHFLLVPSSAWVAENSLAFAMRDPQPVSPGHTLVITKRVVSTWFDASREEQLALMELVDVVRVSLDRGPSVPDGYNVGFDAGEAAGQTIMHLHLHVIPRYRGDMEDPRGGVRRTIARQGRDVRSLPSFSGGGDSDPFSRLVLPLFDVADRVAIVAAFVKESGLARIAPSVRRALARGADIRLLTGDYLEITQVDALEQLLDWQSATALPPDEEGHEPRARLAVRVVEVETLPPPTRSFHPKSWRFESEAFGVAFVGSSNLSLAALDTAVEWNLRIDRARDEQTYRRVSDAFDDLWRIATPLDADFVARYAARTLARSQMRPDAEVEADDPTPLPEPHAVQRDALASLSQARRDGRRRAIVVLATGLGKTMLAAFDYQQMRDEMGRRPRLLFLAHRRELLLQAAATFRRLFRTHHERPTVGWCLEGRSKLDGDLVFASVAKLSRAESIEMLKQERFDYVVIDEVHHASAASYRRILQELDPRFLLGLTATPDRADGDDVVGLFDDFVAARAGVDRGIALGRLVPFRYFGVKDDIEYANIPWRNRFFEPEALAVAVQTEARMQAMWRAWTAHPGRRTLVFCCSVAHALFVRGWLVGRGVRAVAVFAGEGSDGREGALSAIEDGTVDAVCAVDMLNEGVDIPLLDRVVMLRPTDSSVVFLQQLGRGLRAAPGKAHLTVIDFVGNHRAFLDRVRSLLSIRSNGVEDLRRLLSSPLGHVDLPEGCSVDLEMEAKEILFRLFRVDGVDEVERAYREIRASRGTRPSVGELLRMGYVPRKVRERHGSWFDFVNAEKDLADSDAKVFVQYRAFFSDLETLEVQRSLGVVTILVLLEHGALLSGMPCSEVAEHAVAVVQRSPEILADVPMGERPGAADEATAKRWAAFWREGPMAALCAAPSLSRSWFQVVDGRLVFDLAVSEQDQECFVRLVWELVDYRLTQYRRRMGLGLSGDGFVCRVTWNKRDPILKLPTRDHGKLPVGDVDARLSDGAVWVFRFAKEFCNVGRPAGSQANHLPDLLRRWFGPRAGQPGTNFQVRFRATPDGYTVEPERSESSPVVPLPRRQLTAYPDLRAAAGHASEDTESPEAVLVTLPMDSPDPDLFAVRVSGYSMDGGRAPLVDGDWAVFKFARKAPASSVSGRVVLLQVPSETSGSMYQIKRVVEREGTWWATSDNPQGPEFRLTRDAVIVARLERAWRPEQLAPERGAVIAERDLAERFGLETVSVVSCRHEGHLFIFIDQPDMLTSTEQIRHSTVPRPGETAFVLAKRADATWRYLGVGRRDEEERWRIPEVDLETWQRWGAGHGVSRALPEGYRSRAQVLADTLLELPTEDRWVEQSDGRRARIVGGAVRAGIRIEATDAESRERTISLTDLAWVLVADQGAHAEGAVLDEERVNRVRYLEGTPRGSTRWIDTNWALAAVRRAAPLMPAMGAYTQVIDDNGTAVDAQFHVERRGSDLSVVVHSRGGTAGSATARNTEYSRGMEIVLSRLSRLGAKIVDALVDSEATRAESRDKRRLIIPGEHYPIVVRDAAALRAAFGRAQAAVGRKPGAKGAGNATKQVRLLVEVPPELSMESLEVALRGEPHGSATDG